jgi:hypothetical protein
MCLFNRCSKWSSGTCKWDTCQSFAFDQETSWNINFINFINFILYSTSLISSTFGEAWWGQPTKWVKSWDKQDTKTRQENEQGAHLMSSITPWPLKWYQRISKMIKTRSIQKPCGEMKTTGINSHQFTLYHSWTFLKTFLNSLRAKPQRKSLSPACQDLSRSVGFCRQAMASNKS